MKVSLRNSSRMPTPIELAFDDCRSCYTTSRRPRPQNWGNKPRASVIRLLSTASTAVAASMVGFAHD
jgi:hypothetical protein